jgi:hypothetical protein
VIRQFLHNGHLYKEEEERGLSRFELFADLVFVAIIRVCGLPIFTLSIVVLVLTLLWVVDIW